MTHLSGFSAGAIAEQLDGELVGCADAFVCGFAGLEDASAQDLVFIASARWAGKWSKSRSRVALVTRGVDVPEHDPTTRALVIVDDAEVALMSLLEIAAAELRPALQSGISKHALIDSTAAIGSDVFIGDGAIISANATIGDASRIHAGAIIGHRAVVGENAELHANAVLGDDCLLGDRSILHAGAIVGAEGFGFRPDPETGLPRRIPHLGHVEIGDDVEIGAASCVDRGKFGATTIGDGTKIDNLVQIAHNVRIGRGVIIVAQAGLAGSVVVEDGVILGAQVGVAEHVTIGAGARVAATSGVMRDIPAGADYAGTPARPARETLREVAALRKLPALIASVRSCG